MERGSLSSKRVGERGEFGDGMEIVGDLQGRQFRERHFGQHQSIPNRQLGRSRDFDNIRDQHRSLFVRFRGPTARYCYGEHLQGHLRPS